MSLWKQNKIKKQQRKKRTRKVLKARDEVLSLLVADKVRKAGELASIVLKKHPGDIRAWRLVAGVKAWEKFDERIRGFPTRRKDELKASALKVMKRELASRDNLRTDVLAETLISLVPAGEVAVEEEPVVTEKAPAVVEAPEAVPAEKASTKKSPSPRKSKTAEAPTSEKTDRPKKPSAKKGKAEPKKSTQTRKAAATKKTETAGESTKKEPAKKSQAKKKTK